LSVISLGIPPFVIGFVIVELLSFVLPRGDKLRRGGIAGRLKLNVFATRVGLGLALVQAASIAMFLQEAVAVDGARLVPKPGLLFILSSSCPP
jgi:preprotein translocase subunit SecY